MTLKSALYAGFAASLALGLAACGGGEDATTATQEAAPMDDAARLDAVLAGDHRSDEERARDEFRHPKETLEFFGLEPTMTVVEVYPGGGKTYAASFPAEGASERARAALDTFRKTYVENPDLYGAVEMTTLGEGHHIAPEGSADMVVTFRNLHSFMGRGIAEETFEEFYRALKPGGVLGIVEHRADGAELPRDGSSGYVYTDDVVAMAEAAGFEFEAASEINANTADTKDHPFGVWTLPPVRRSAQINGEDDPSFDRARYDAIGESDRMTLKFRKPIAADGALLE
jgi:predicted methyltransferase